MFEYIKIILLLATCLIILLTFFRLKSENLKREICGFLISSFFLTLLLVLIIEIKPHHIFRAKLGVSNLITYLIYFVLITIYFLIYIKTIIRFKYFLIIISFMLFGLANAVDLLSDGKLITLNYNEFFEDTFHILGTISWLLFFINYSNSLKSITNNRHTEATNYEK